MNNLAYVSPDLRARIRKYLAAPGTHNYAIDSVERGLTLDCCDAMQDAYDTYQILLAVSEELTGRVE